MALMREHGSYLTADEAFVCKLMDLGIFDVKPFIGYASSDRVIVEIDFKKDIDADNYCGVRLWHGKLQSCENLQPQ